MKSSEITSEMWAKMDAKVRKGWCARRSAERRAAKAKGEELPPTMAEQVGKGAQVEPETKRVIVDNDLIPPKDSKKKAPVKKATKKK